MTQISRLSRRAFGFALAGAMTITFGIGDTWAQSAKPIRIGQTWADVTPKGGAAQAASVQ